MGEKPGSQDENTEQTERESPTRGSLGRASAAGTAVGDPGSPAQLTDAKTSAMDDWHQQSRTGGGGASEPVEASNLNLSKSNINRQAGPGVGAGANELAIGDQGAVEEPHRPRPHGLGSAPAPGDPIPDIDVS